jgi:hypothetical protein
MITTEVTFTVSSDDDYKYEVCAGEVLSVTYKEYTGQEIFLSFGSVEEMEAVAHAMLRACLVRDEKI